MKCPKFRVKIVIAVIGLCVLSAAVLLYKSEEIHARRRLGPQPIVTRPEGFHLERYQSKNLWGLDSQKIELEKELKLLALLKKANVSNHGLLTKTNDSMVGEGSLKKYLLRSDVRKALQLRTLNGTLSVSDKKKQACVIPELDPFGESIRKYLSDEPPLKCSGIMITDIKNKQLVLRKSVAQKINYTVCYASSIERVTDFTSRVLPPVKILVDQSVPVRRDIPLKYNMTSDFTIVGCLDQKTNISSEELDEAFGEESDFDAFFSANPRLFDVHARIHPKPETLKRVQNAKRPADGLGLNVVLLTLEATSRMNFIRKLPQTREVLEELGAVILEGYNIVADATSGAMIPILTGKTELELPEVRRSHPGSKYVDSYPMIWREFAKKGYATMFAEDLANIATFNRVFNGFDLQPTDHYLRTMWLAAEERKHCLGPMPVHNMMLDYLLDFMNEYKTTPNFALAMPSGLTHADINPLQLMDSGLSWFLSKAHSLGLLNNTMLVFFGDHGARYSAIRKSLQGKLEERLPFMSITLPPWVSKKHPDLVRNLRKNRKRLVTPFDVHETLRSVIHYNPKPGSVDQRGISLFNEIPRERTCEHAGIAPHWCSCLNWKPANLQKTNQVAEALLADINKNTEQVRTKCAELSVSVVLHAQKLVPGDKVLRFVNTDDDHRVPAFNDSATVRVSDVATIYQVTLETQPGGGLFEGTVKVLPRSKGNYLAFESTGDISRINRYGSQADCIKDIFPQATKFCYCRKA